MSYHNHDGHAATLAEPNGPPLSEVTPPTSKKNKTSRIEKQEPDEMDQLMQLMEFGEESNDTLSDSTEAVDLGEITAAVSPIPDIPVIKNKVYGRYRAQLGSFELEMRLDIDGVSPLQKLSGDYYQVNGQTKSYFGSFIVDSITKTIANGVITVTGIANTTWATSYKKIKVAVKQTNILQPLAPALLQWFHATTNVPGALYVCNHFNRAFRTVRLEQDSTAGIVPFTTYNTGSLPSGGPARVLSINTAYQEAGVEMINAGISNVVPIVNITSPATKWSDAELHASMVNKIFNLINIFSSK